MKPTLIVLAAGMGSRYGGLKQMDGLGPNGETIMDYSIFDAIRSGFGKVVFVIRKDFEADFRAKIVSKYENHIPVEVVFQALENLPEGYTVPEGRTKPWGTNHALMMAKGVVNEPFAIINADDFYGRDSFEVMAKGLTTIEGKKNQYLMVGFRLVNTLSENGTVARGLCTTDENGMLQTVVERTSIGWDANHENIVFTDENGELQTTAPNVPCSMNLWGFTPEYFDYSDEHFVEFLKNNSGNLKAEFFIPLVVNDLLATKKISLKVLDTTSKWFGVTYAADRQGVVDKIATLIKAGEYPEQLFK